MIPFAIPLKDIGMEYLDALPQRNTKILIPILIENRYLEITKAIFPSKTTATNIPIVLSHQ